MFRAHYEGIGGIDEKGILRVPADLNDFLRNNKGARVIVKVSAYDKRSVSAIRNYYLRVIVPAFREALYESGDRCTYKTAEERLRAMTVTCVKEIINYDTGEVSETTKELKELCAAEWVEYIDEIKQILAEAPLCIYVEDGRIL